MFFILTGGTIDSYYDTDKCTAIPFNGSITGSTHDINKKSE